MVQTNSVKTEIIPDFGQHTLSLLKINENRSGIYFHSKTLINFQMKTLYQIKTKCIHLEVTIKLVQERRQLYRL